MMILYAVMSFVICLLLYPFFINFLRAKKVGKFIREDGPDLHGYKAGTPTMGGILFVLVAATFALLSNEIVEMLSMIFFGLIGFLDDYAGLRWRKSLGLRAWQKFSLQVVCSVLLLALMGTHQRNVLLPFSHISIDLGYLYPVFAVLIMVGFSNAANLTDGLDGLLGSVFLTASLPYWFFLNRGANSLLYLSVAVIAFLFYNIKPAKVFMGDTGSLALGGLLGTVAVKTSTELFLICFAPILVLEVLSVMLQVSSFKLFKKRIFKMSPIHHHFELLGWKEERIVQIFSLVNLTLALFTLLGVQSM